MMAALCVCGHPRSDHENRPGIFATWCLKKVRAGNNNDFCSCEKYHSALRAAKRAVKEVATLKQMKARVRKLEDALREVKRRCAPNCGCGTGEWCQDCMPYLSKESIQLVVDVALGTEPVSDTPATDTETYVLHLEEWNKRLVAWLERTDRNYRHLPRCKYDLLGTMKCSCGYDNLVKGLVWPEGKR